MPVIREFKRTDISAVADLYVRAYKHPQQQAAASFKHYFEEIYFNNPWYDPALPSFVYEGESGQISGFVAVFPRPMEFLGKRIRAAVLSTIMVDPRLRGRSIGSQLMQRAFDGPQDLFFTDGANGASRKLWQAVGGRNCLLYSCRWRRILRPSSYALAIVQRKPALRPVVMCLKPVAAGLDALAVRFRSGPYGLKQIAVTEENASGPALLEYMARFKSRDALVPLYDPASLDWLLGQAAQATARGRLEAVIVKDANSEPLGWYVFYANPGRVSQVLQIGAAQESVALVLSSLFHRAWRAGATAVAGQFEPKHVSELSALHCDFLFRTRSVLIHSRNPMLERAIDAGDTSLSRLDGEWWMRFSDGLWS